MEDKTSTPVPANCFKSDCDNPVKLSTSGNFSKKKYHWYVLPMRPAEDVPVIGRIRKGGELFEAEIYRRMRHWYFAGNDRPLFPKMKVKAWRFKSDRHMPADKMPARPMTDMMGAIR